MLYVCISVVSCKSELQTLEYFKFESVPASGSEMLTNPSLTCNVLRWMPSSNTLGYEKIFGNKNHAYPRKNFF
jgi:hypothetical protein